MNSLGFHCLNVNLFLSSISAILFGISCISFKSDELLSVIGNLFISVKISLLSPKPKIVVFPVLVILYSITDYLFSTLMESK